MPIQSDDIKLLKSAVMADVPEGGGAMTGVQIVDGETHNMFPPISTDDATNGRVQFRKVFGVAHSDDDDTLLGAGFSVLLPPVDPNVHVACFETDGWDDDLATARQAVARYLVKGAKLLSRIQDVHYQGALLLQLYNIAPATDFPTPGETIVVRNPNGAEQYVRVVKTTISSSAVPIGGGSGAADLTAITVCSCELNQPLAFDLLGAPVQPGQPSVLVNAFAYSTTPSLGIRFHGVKKLGVPATVGQRSLKVAGGIFTPLVPATTNPQPVIDVYPLVERSALSRTATAVLILPLQTLALTPGKTLRLPTSCEPGTLTMSHGGTDFTTNNAGDLLQGAVVVGTVDYRARSLTMAGTAPNYGTASNQITYKPATVTGATAHSNGKQITEANQSLAYVFALEPIPAPGTLTVSYMAQGRWYDLTEDGSGKLAGADSSYGTGSLNFLTGSLALSLGAVPDIGSLIVMTWGEAASARAAVSPAVRAWAWLPLATQPEPGTMVFTYLTNSGAQTVSVDASGVVTGPAQVGVVERVAGGGYRVKFSPDVLPTTPITVTFTTSAEAATFTNDGGGQYTLSGAPIKAGSVRFNMIGASGASAIVYPCYTVGTVVYTGSTVIGAINNTTGVMLLNGAASAVVTTHKQVKVNP